MIITYIGLSSFLIENKQGYRILIDPFNDSPEWTLGPKFPKDFRGKPFGANIVLMSEPDADHSYAPGGWLQHAPSTKPNSNPFPNLDLRGTIVYEWNGDLNIAYSYAVDSVRCTHLADNGHVLTAEQVKEIGSPDILFISPAKVKLDGKEDRIAVENISLLKPKIVIWAHHIAPQDLPESDNSEILRPYFEKYFRTHVSTNRGYKDENSFISLCYVLENAFVLNQKYGGIEVKNPELEITPELLAEGAKNTKSILFKRMLAL